MAIWESIQLGAMGAGSVVIALLACDSKLDNDKLDKGITNMFEEQLELEVKEVSCPKDIKIEKDKEFECEVSVKPKGKVPVEVVITDEKDGSVSMKTKYKVLIPKTLKKEAGIECDKVQVLKPGSTFTCEKDGQPIKATVNDDEGVAWE